MAEIETIEANGIRFAYLSEGAGPLALLFHGFPDTAHTWDDVRPRLAARGFRVVTPFLRGYAPTEIPKRDTDMLTLARDVLALIDAFGADRATLVGHDWGAVAVYGAASLAPERVTKLVTVAIPHPLQFEPTLRRVWAARHFFANRLPGAAARFAKNGFAGLRAIYARWSPTWDPPESEFGPAKACFANRASLDAAFGYYRMLPLTKPPPHLRVPIEVPTIAFAGLDDSIAQLVDYEMARSTFSAEYVVETMRGGHFMHREHPDDFFRRLENHLAP